VGAGGTVAHPVVRNKRNMRMVTLLSMVCLLIAFQHSITGLPINMDIRKGEYENIHTGNFEHKR
jgi:hypothetical protein